MNTKHEQCGMAFLCTQDCSQTFRPLQYDSLFLLWGYPHTLVIILYKLSCMLMFWHHVTLKYLHAMYILRDYLPSHGVPQCYGGPGLRRRHLIALGNRTVPLWFHDYPEFFKECLVPKIIGTTNYLWCLRISALLSSRWVLCLLFLNSGMKYYEYSELLLWFTDQWCLRGHL